MRNDRASIFNDGCLSMKSLMVPAESIITSTATIIAATITGTWETMPTAVITESRENTISMMAIWMMVPIKLPAAPFGWSLVSSSPSRPW
ncbi:hypothetical protein D9M68_967740 [compost metagenome]